MAGTMCVLCILALLGGVFTPAAFAAAEPSHVTMASYDLDGDGADEIVRTEDSKGTTAIHIYKRLPASHFFKPCQTFTVTGKLVQVPEIVDVNHDGSKEYFFATGMAMGVIYYDPLAKRFEKTSDFNFSLELPREEPVTAVETETHSASLQAPGTVASVTTEPKTARPMKSLTSAQQHDEGGVAL